jgi:hypothetical protein
MWPLRKPDPDDESVEKAFLLVAAMWIIFILWQLIFPWWPLVKR